MIGTHLAQFLRDRGDEVWILTRRPPRDAFEAQWDPTRGLTDPRLVEACDGIFNLVGEHLADRPWTKARRRLLKDSRVKTTDVLLASLSNLDAPPPVFVGVSSLGLFGDCGDRFVSDDDGPGTGFLAEMCIEWEQAHLSAEEYLAARVAVLRMSVVLSPTGGAFPLMVQPFRYVGGWLGNGRQYTPWISIRDCVGALCHLMDQQTCEGAFNGTVPQPIPNMQWAEALGRVMAVPVVTHAPKWALRGALGELAESLFLASIRAVPTKLESTGYTFVDPDVEETFRWLLPAFEEAKAADRLTRRRRRRRR